MPDISEKGIKMPASPIRKLVPYADAAKDRGIKVYHLNIGQPDIASPQTALNAIRNFENRVIEYGHSAGNLSYRKKLAKYYNELKIDISYEDILITAGGSEALLIALNVCLNPGDEVIVPEPFYTNYNSFALQAGVKIKPITTKIESGFAMPLMKEFENMITPSTKAILLCNPNNPTGYLYSRKELEQLGEIVAKHDLFLISDEVYREFCYDDFEYFSCMELKGIEDNVILIDSTSKRYSMCGIRVGAIVTRNKKVTESILHFCQSRLCAPIIGQIAAEAALDTPDTYFSNMHKEYLSRRNCLVERLNKIRDVFCPMPKGAFYTIVRLPVDDAEKFAIWLLDNFEYQGQTVMLAPAAGFYHTQGKGINEVRIAYVLQKPDLINAIRCLKYALEKYNR
ncbi:MAG: pyridoxal phosphate-dependent aminotransferase [Dysgonamonadaceae bacterium]|jgi:aspartate aminotransferase|nr:pyridoxal phosphate-dependent aminotransferase [Dysgonamonadaceae bacterium]